MQFHESYSKLKILRAFVRDALTTQLRARLGCLVADSVASSSKHRLDQACSLACLTFIEVTTECHLPQTTLRCSSMALISTRQPRLSVSTLITSACSRNSTVAERCCARSTTP